MFLQGTVLPNDFTFNSRHMAAAQNQEQFAVLKALGNRTRNNSAELPVCQAGIGIVIQYKNQSPIRAMVMDSMESCFPSINPFRTDPEVFGNRFCECFQIVFISQLPRGKIDGLLILDKLGDQRSLADIPPAVNGGEHKTAAVICLIQLLQFILPSNKHTLPPCNPTHNILSIIPIIPILPSIVNKCRNPLKKIQKSAFFTCQIKNVLSYCPKLQKGGTSQWFKTDIYSMYPPPVSRNS